MAAPRNPAPWRPPRLFWVIVTGGLLVAFAATLTLFLTTRAASLRQQLDIAAAHYERRFAELRRGGDATADALRSQIEFFGLVEAADGQFDRLTAFLVMLGAQQPFSQLTLTDRAGAVRYAQNFRTGTAVPVPPAMTAVSAWMLGPDNAIYRVVRLPVWAGSGGLWALHLFQPVTQATLESMQYPGATVTLLWDGRPVLQRAGTADAPAGERVIELDDPRFRLAIAGRFESPLSLLNAVVFVVGGCLIALAAVVVLALLLTRRAEQRSLAAVRRTERRLRGVIGHLPNSFSLKDAERRFVLVNPVFEAAHRLTPDQVLGRTWGDLADALGDPQLRDAHVRDARAAESGQPVVMELQRELPGLGRRDLIITSFPVFDDQGRLDSIGTTMTDVTDMKRIQRALAEREAALTRYQAATRAILIQARQPETIFAQLLSGILRSVGEAMRADRVEIWRPDSVGRLVSQAVWIRPDAGLSPVPDWLDAAAVVALLAGDVDMLVEQARDGGVEPSLRRHVAVAELGTLLAARVQLGGPGSSLLVCAARAAEPPWEAETRVFVRSVADLVATVMLERRQEEALAALDSSSDGMLAWAADGRLLFANQRVADITGLDGSEARELARLESVMKLGSAVDPASGRRTGQWTRPDGRRVELEIRDHALPRGGQLTTFADVTEERQRERRQSELESRLQQSTKMEAIGRLAGGVAHDFNNLLSTIMGYGHFLVEDLPPDGELHDFASRVVKASQRGADLVKQILAFSRRVSVERAPTDLNGVVLEVASLLRKTLPATTRLAVSVSDHSLVSVVNATEISQIVMNLCINANDALGGWPGAISVALLEVGAGELGEAAPDLGGADLASGTVSRVSWGTLDPTRRHARLTVADTGTGIEPETMQRIFEPFFTTKSVGQGTGLGLSVVHGLVLGYEGSGTVTSRVGAGTTFTIQIPLTAEAAAVAAPPPPPRPIGAERVMVVDDDGDVADMLAAGLRRLGYDVVPFRHPDDAVAAYAAPGARWDVVISDQVMPDCTGLDLHRRLSGLAPPRLFILCTGFSDGSLEEAAVEAGIHDLLLKPMQLDAVAQVIRRHFDRPAPPPAGADIAPAAKDERKNL